MHHVELNAQSRSKSGKGAARSLRREGKVPAVLYGHGIESRALAVESRALGRLLEVIGGEATLVDVAIDGGTPIKALVREVQRNPVKRAEVIHIDLYAVVAGEPNVVEVHFDAERGVEESTHSSDPFVIISPCTSIAIV